MFLGSFRSNVWFSIDDDINLVGWLEDPMELWDKNCVKHMTNLNNIAKGISGGSFGNAFIINPAIYTYQFTEHEYGAHVIKHVKSPEFYMMSTTVLNTLNVTVLKTLLII